MVRSDRRTLDGMPTNSVWDGERITLFAARNEVVGFALVLDAGEGGVDGVRVQLPELFGPDDYRLTAGRPPPEASPSDVVFDWRDRQIEAFLVSYLPIEGLSLLTWGNYDERHVPERMRRPWTEPLGIATGGWTDRPDHDTWYPDIAEPMELHPTFDIAPGNSQMVWFDIYVPADARPGVYHGTVFVRENAGEGGVETRRIPVSLRVRRFALPDTPSAPTMMVLGYGDVNMRYVGEAFPDNGPKAALTEVVRNRHFQMAHRHKISLIDANVGPEPWLDDAPRPSWWPRLDGTLFTAQHGYDGPGVGVGTGVFSIGTYGIWDWQDQDEVAMWARTDAWSTWFNQNSPETEVFLYLVDESHDWPQVQQWAAWMDVNPGPGRDILSFATSDFAEATERAPALQVPCTTLKVQRARRYEEAARAYSGDPDRRLWLYNGARPATGTLALEDDGVAMRQWGWTQFLKHVERWFVWESTYYVNRQGGTGDTRLFSSAHTFGGFSGVDPVNGRTGWNYTNGDGVLFYPGTDQVFPDESRGLDGPIASLRLKYWRRGLQDADYLALAAAVDPEATRAVARTLLPRVVWEYDVDNYSDPTYTHTDISWSTDPDAWEAARAALADIIERGEATVP